MYLPKIKSKHFMLFTRIMLIAVVFVFISGCNNTDSWQTLYITKAQKEHEASILLLSPPYGPNARTPDTVEVKWDNETIFHDKLPANLEDPIGTWVDLLVITCDPGAHKLEVISGPDSMSIDVMVEANDTRIFKLFGIVDKQEVLLSESTDDPHF